MNNPVFWEREYRSKLNNSFRSKVIQIEKMIPSDVISIIDIGCGNGIICNELGKKYNVTATDRSWKGLQSVQVKKFQALCNHVSLKSATFDMVFCSEVLEHLESNEFLETIGDIKRLSRKYIFITVPYSENIRKNLVECPRCKKQFNRSSHLRSFTKSSLIKYFSEYQLIDFCTFGKKVRGYNTFLEKIKHRFSPAESWIQPRWTPDGYRFTLCLNCSFEFEIPYRFHPVAFICDTLNMFLSPKKPYQMFALYKIM